MLHPWITEMNGAAADDGSGVVQAMTMRILYGKCSLSRAMEPLLLRLIGFCLTFLLLDLSLNPPEGVTVEDASTFKR